MDKFLIHLIRVDKSNGIMFIDIISLSKVSAQVSRPFQPRKLGHK